jgi:ornithine cyclodeaminase/alanine dehydrogenase-like protein (mu-crystallin family)
VTHPGLPVIDAATLRERVGFADLIEPVAAAFRDSSAGQAENGLIILFPAETREAGDVYIKAGALRGHRVFVTKVSPWFARNTAERRPQGGFIAVFDSSTGHTLAILDDQHYLSDIRTAAAGALAACYLCPTRVETAAVLGSGTQAYWQTLALHRERPFTQLTIWARDSGKAEILRSRLGRELPSVHLAVTADRESAVRQADAVITATPAREPLVLGEWLRAGQHITAVGADDPTKCELDGAALRKARVFVDSVPTAEHNGDVRHAIQNDGYSINLLAGEIGDVVSGRLQGRASAGDITIAKFVGLGAQDLAAAEVALLKLGIL